MSARSSSSERGATLAIFALLLTFVFIPIMGLGVDYTLVYMAKIRLMSAADAAALAGCRAFTSSDTSSSTITSVQQVATQYFDANFPSGYLNSTITRNAAAQIDNNKYRTVTVTAQAVVPTTFLSFLGTPTITLQQTATTSRRNVSIMLVLDRSGSMNAVCGTLRTTATNFVNGFADGLDSMGLIVFSGGPVLGPALNSTFKTNMTQTISTIQCAGRTGTAEALSIAAQQLQQNAQPGTLKVIVLFTDGAPNGYRGTFLIAHNSATNDKCFNQHTVLQNGQVIAQMDAVVADNTTLDSPNPLPITSTSGSNYADKTNCLTGNPDAITADFPYIPMMDAYGNSGTGQYSVATTTDYLGNTQIVMATKYATPVSTNAAMDAAVHARTSDIRVYSIGLGSNGGIDSAFLTTIANDPAGPTYNSAQPAGRYAYAANASQLQNAFNSIKSEILRISQ